MNRYRHVQRSARFPHRIKASIIDFHQWPFRNPFAQIESERLEDFQSARACLMRASDLVGLKLRIAWFVDALPPGLSKGHKAIWVGLRKFLDDLLEALPHSSGKVHHHANIFAIHQRQHGIRCCGMAHGLAYTHPFDFLGFVGKVRVNVNQRITRTRHFVFRNVQHAPRLKIFEL